MNIIILIIMGLFDRASSSTSNIRLLIISHLLHRFTFGILSVIIFQNMSKGLTLTKVGIVLAVTAALHFLFLFLQRKKILPFNQKHILVFFATVQFFSAFVYSCSKEGYLMIGCAIFSIASVALSDVSSFTFTSQVNLLQTLIRLKVKNQQQYFEQRQSIFRQSSIVGSLLQGLGAFVAGSYISYARQRPNELTELNEDSNFVINFYVFLIIFKIGIYLMLGISKADKICNQKSIIAGKWRSSMLSPLFNFFGFLWNIVDTVLATVLSQSILSYYLFNTMVFFYRQVGFFYLIVNFSLAAAEEAIYYLQNSWLKRWLAHATIVLIASFLCKFVNHQIQSTNYKEIVALIAVYILDKEMRYLRAKTLKNKTEEQEGVQNKCLWKFIRYFGYLINIATLIYCGFVFQRDHDSIFLRYYLQFAIALKLVHFSIYILFIHIEAYWERCQKVEVQKFQKTEDIEDLDIQEMTNRRL